MLDDGVRAFAIAADPDVTAGEVREGVDRVLDDLARMSDAAPDRFEAQVAQVREALLDIRRSLLDLGDETPFEEARLLIDETCPGEARRRAGPSRPRRFVGHCRCHRAGG